jgi:hypothetical protein
MTNKSRVTERSIITSPEQFAQRADEALEHPVLNMDAASVLYERQLILYEPVKLLDVLLNIGDRDELLPEQPRQLWRELPTQLILLLQQ